jgi:adenine-specific DNA-methyltransferase
VKSNKINGGQNKQLSLFEDNFNIVISKNVRKLITFDKKDIFDYFNKLNNDSSHFESKDDVCTPMECVETMLDYLPKEVWKKPNLKVLDPCSGNGNFGAYAMLKSSIDNIWFNELNPIRYLNCKTILNPKNITNSDAFELDKINGIGWDIIMANPPYSGGGNKNQSISNLFIEKSIDLLASGGYLCFVTPNNWMTYNNNNTTLRKLLYNGSFLVIDNDVKKYFPSVGSSFTIFIWQKDVFTNKTMVKNNYLLKDRKKSIVIPKISKFIPLYISKSILSIIDKTVIDERNEFDYRCDLHNFTQRKRLSDVKHNNFIYETIHTARKTRYSNYKQDIFDNFNIVVPLSTYYIPFIKSKVNVTQSVGYISFDKESDAVNFLKKMVQPHIKLIVHLTRYGNFNNIKVLRHLAFNKAIKFNKAEIAEINKLVKLIKY